jgi:hypothetical protein
MSLTALGLARVQTAIYNQDFTFIFGQNQLESLSVIADFVCHLLITCSKQMVPLVNTSFDSADASDTCWRFMSFKRDQELRFRSRIVVSCSSFTNPREQRPFESSVGELQSWSNVQPECMMCLRSMCAIM